MWFLTSLDFWLRCEGAIDSFFTYVVLMRPNQGQNSCLCLLPYEKIVYHFFVVTYFMQILCVNTCVGTGRVEPASQA